MMPITIRELECAVGGVCRTTTEDPVSISAVSTDSRSIKQGCLFIPLTGERFDGHRFIDAALDAGAAGVLCARLPEVLRPDKFYIQVEDTRLSLKLLAKAYRERFHIPVIQITGSVGKTTTKDMIASVLASRFHVLKTPENLNNDIGTPLTLLQLTPEHEVAVIETGMNHFGEIRYLGDLVQPDVAVISNIGDAHIEFLDSREGILRAKSEIFEHLKPDGTAILNGDDPLLNTLEPPFTTIRCGKSDHCDARVSEVLDLGVSGVECTVTTESKSYRLKIPSPGEHMVYAASIATAIGERMGLTEEEIIRGVASYQSSGSRMRVVRLSDNRTVLDDCYNASPQSVAAALEILAKTECGRKIAVLGDMGELGDLTERAHYNMGSLAAMLGIELTVAIGPKAAKIAQGVENGGGTVFYFEAKEDAVSMLLEEFGGDTAMLVKASHAMEFEWLVEQLCK